MPNSATNNKPNIMSNNTSGPRVPAAPQREARAALGTLWLASFAALLPACAHSNSRNRLADDISLQAFQPARQVLSSQDTQRADDPPSLTSLDRSAWEPVTLAIPVDATHHRPTYRFLAPIGPRQLRRQRGEYPTAASALDLDGGPASSRQRFYESILEPIHASLELARLPLAMAIHQPWRRAWSPMGSYDRARNLGERPETMDDLHDTNIPRRMSPAYEDESLFIPNDPTRENDNSNRPPSQADPTTDPSSPAPSESTSPGDPDAPATIPQSTPAEPAPTRPAPSNPDGGSRR